MKKTCFILALIILTMTLAGCQPADVPSADTSAVEDVAETTEADSLVRIVADGASDYMVLRADRAPDTEVDAAVALRKAIDETYGIRMRIGNEIDAQPELAIIVGNVNYGGAAEIAATLGYYDYIITFSGEHLVICGGSPEATQTAVGVFIDKYLSKDSATLAVPKDLKRRDLLFRFKRARRIILCSLVLDTHSARGKRQKRGKKQCRGQKER